MTVEILLGQIRVLPDHRRKLRQDVVCSLAESMQERGLLHPVTLRPAASGYDLVSGHHRLEAARKLRWQAIRAEIREGDDAIDAELYAIDENLIRADLSPAEQAAHHARRKELYEQRHPETKKGATGRGRKKSQVATSNNPAPAFVDDAAQKTGKDRSTIARAVRRGRAIPNVADLAGTSLDKGDALDALASLPTDLQAVVIERAKAHEKVSAKVEIKKERRREREAELGGKIAAGNLSLPAKQFGVIYADPAWGSTVYSAETGMDRHAANHYPVATGTKETQDDAIKALRVASIAAKDCVLGLWCTDPWRGSDVMRAWGFEPVSYFVWVKDVVVVDPAANGMLRSGQVLKVTGQAGLGRWNRDRCEIMLIGVRGNPVCPALGTQGERVWFASRGEHSDKPDCALQWFERHWPNTPKIELHARRSRSGWDAWGLDAPSQRRENASNDPRECNTEGRRTETINGPRRECSSIASDELEADGLAIPSFLDRRQRAPGEPSALQHCQRGTVR